MQELEKYSLDDTYIRPFDRDKQEIAIETENLRVFYGENEAIHKVSLPFE
ncbi:MAG: phosphate ABC transporter ATP-binding protein, partial [Lacticaseibacillus paracasei]|nr:phosphate ABC transporter ATP-binding protein [Lacticaseibacillus paracasei]